MSSPTTERPPADATVEVEAFKEAIARVCREHGLSISHEDSQGAFLVDNWSEVLEKWWLAARPDAEFEAKQIQPPSGFTLIPEGYSKMDFIARSNLEGLNPRVVHWARAQGIDLEVLVADPNASLPSYSDGAPWTVHFIIWIQERWRAWATELGYRDHRVALASGHTHADFDTWLEKGTESKKSR